jgi:hypothetical protein
LRYLTARLSRFRGLSRSRGFAKGAKTAKSTAFSFAAETPAKEKRAEREKIFSLRTLRLAVNTAFQL